MKGRDGDPAPSSSPVQATDREEEGAPSRRRWHIWRRRPLGRLDPWWRPRGDQIVRGRTSPFAVHTSTASASSAWTSGSGDPVVWQWQFRQLPTMDLWIRRMVDTALLSTTMGMAAPGDRPRWRRGRRMLAAVLGRRHQDFDGERIVGGGVFWLGLRRRDRCGRWCRATRNLTLQNGF